MPRYGRQAAIANASTKSTAASGAIRVIAVAHANDEVAWAEGKLRERRRAAERRQALENRALPGARPASPRS